MTVFAASLKELGKTTIGNIGYAVLFLAIIAAMIGIGVLAEKLINKRKEIKQGSSYRINRMVIIGMLAAISVVLNVFDFPVWFAPGFYKLDFSELPIIIGAFALGPVAGITIEAVKIILNLVINGTVTAFVGEIANFCMGCAYIIPAAIIYYNHKNRKNAFLGLTAGTVVAVVLGAVFNAFVLLPTYAKIYFGSESLDMLIGMGTDCNGSISGLMSFIMLAVVPFNLLKYGAVSIVTAVIYKPVSHLLKRPAGRG